MTPYSTRDKLLRAARYRRVAEHLRAGIVPAKPYRLVLCAIRGERRTDNDPIRRDLKALLGVWSDTGGDRDLAIEACIQRADALERSADQSGWQITGTSALR